MGVLTKQMTTGTITANGGLVTLPLKALSNGGCSIQITGTWTGTITFQIACDNNTTYVSYLMTSYSTGTVASTTTGNDTFWANYVGATDVQAKATATITGSASIRITALGG